MWEDLLSVELIVWMKVFNHSIMYLLLQLECNSLCNFCNCESSCDSLRAQNRESPSLWICWMSHVSNTEQAISYILTFSLYSFRLAIANFAKVLKPGGILIIDHRNYDSILEKGKAHSTNIYYNVRSFFHYWGDVLLKRTWTCSRKKCASS